VCDCHLETAESHSSSLFDDCIWRLLKSRKKKRRKKEQKAGQKGKRLEEEGDEKHSQNLEGRRDGMGFKIMCKFLLHL